MKRPLLFLLTVILCFSLCACGSDAQGSGDVVKPDLADQIVVTEYSCVISEDFQYYILFLKNTSDKCVSVEANMVAKNEAGEDIGAYSESAHAIAPDQTSCVWTTFDEWESIKSFEYTLSVKEDSIDRSIFDKVEIDYNTTESKVVATATNNGAEAASFVWFDVVFLKNGEMVGFGEISLMNDDSQLPAGASITNEGECYSEGGFDEIAVAVNGRIQ